MNRRTVLPVGEVALLRSAGLKHKVRMEAVTRQMEVALLRSAWIETAPLGMRESANVAAGRTPQECVD